MSAREIALVIVTTLLMLLAARSIADAHAMLVSSDPTSGARLAASPARVRLVFSEELEPALARLSLVSEGGRITDLAVSGDPHDVYAIIAPVAVLEAGSYRLMWRVVSADGHPVEGSVVFWVGNTAASTPPAPVSLDVPSTWGPVAVGAPLIPAALRGIGLGSLMSLAGLLFCMSLPRGRHEPPQDRARKLATVLAAAAAVVLTLHLGVWILNATPDHHIGGASTRALLSSNIGMMESWRTGLTVLALWALVLARRPRLALVLAVAALVASGATGHSAAISPEWAEPARSVHLLAGAAWIGALLYLLVHDRNDSGGFTRDAFRVSTIALVAAFFVVFSGVVQARLFLSSPWDLVGSSYGTILLAKIAGFIIVILFGAYHRYRVLPRLVSDATRSGRFARTLWSEISVMVAVILLGGLLAYVSPPHHPVPPAGHSAQITTTSTD